MIAAASDDPNPHAAEDLKQTLIHAATPVPTIQPVSDSARLKELRQTQAKFQEKIRLHGLSREARMLQEQVPGKVRLRVLRPRAQLVGVEKRVADAYGVVRVSVKNGEGRNEEAAEKYVMHAS